MSAREPEASEARRTAQQQEAEQAFRDGIAKLVLAYVDSASPSGDKRDDALHQLMAVTGRSHSTVRNWFKYRIGLPDLEAMARIVGHWKLPPTEVFKAEAIQALDLGAASSSAGSAKALPSLPIGQDSVVLKPGGRNDPDSIKEALQRYSKHPERLILLRNEDCDGNGVVEQHELMLVDTSVERITASGLHVLRTADAAGHQRVLLRAVQVLIGGRSARVSAPNPALAPLWEDLPLSAEGAFASGVSVLGRVVGVLRAT